MNKSEIIKRHRKMYDDDTHKCLTNIDDVEFAIIYGDDGGDTYIKKFNNIEDFNKGLDRHIVKGITGCDFDTTVYHILKNGEEYKPTIS